MAGSRLHDTHGRFHGRSRGVGALAEAASPRPRVEEGIMDSRPAIPSVPPHRAAFGARRDGLIRALATGVTVLVAAIAVLLVAFAAVVITIS